MTEIEVSLFDQEEYGHSFFEDNREIDMPEVKDSGKDCNNRLVLASREERVALLKNGLTGKDIESLYIKFNDIIVIGINWQDLKSR
jgi:hypothetical protein